MIDNIEMTDSNAALKNTIINTKVMQKYIIFTIDGERYGIPLFSVKEVIGIVKVTPIPHVPDFFKGLINLRGRIISVIDMRLKLGIEEINYVPKKTSIIIFDVNDLTIGSIVDDVNEVIGFTDGQIEQKLELSNCIKKKYILNIAKSVENKLIMLLDIHKMLNPEELTLISEKTNKKGHEIYLDNE